MLRGGGGLIVNQLSDEDSCPEEHRDEGPLLIPVEGICPACPSTSGRSIATTQGSNPAGKLLSSFQIPLEVLTSGPQVRRIHLHGNRTHNQFDRDYQPQLLLPPTNHSLHPRQRPAVHSDPPARRQVGMRLGAKLPRPALAQSFHLIVGKRGGRPATSHQAGNAGYLKNAQAVSQREPHKNVAREQRHLQLHPAIFPSPHAVIERQKVLHPPLVEKLR